MSDISFIQIIAKIRELLENNQLKSASQILLDITDKIPPRFRNEIIVHGASIKQIYTEERQGIVKTETTRLEKKRAMYAILDLLDEIRESLSINEKQQLLPNLNNLSTESKGIIIRESRGEGDYSANRAREKSSGE